MRAALQVLHPAERPAGGPSPVVLFLGAANVPAECFPWLAARLVAAGYVAVLPSTILRYGPEAVLLPLPYDVAALGSWEAYKRGPAAEGAALLLDELRKLNDARGGPLHNALDLNTVVVGVRALHAPAPSWLGEALTNKLFAPPLLFCAGAWHGWAGGAGARSIQQHFPGGGGRVCLRRHA